jgi:hypothetical protein
MPMIEDLTAFFNADEHATEVRLDGRAVSGILDRGYVDVSGMGTTRPTFTCAHSAVPHVAEGSSLVAPADPVSGEILSYSVRQPEPDGTGLVVLPLTLE